MRNALQLTIVLMFFLLGFISTGQTIDANKFPVDSAVWYEYDSFEYHDNPLPVNGYTSNNKYYYNGVDFFNGNTFGVIYGSRLQKCTSGPCDEVSPVLYEDYPVGAALRIDSNKVYVYYSDFADTATVLYDYGIEIGDTFTNYVLMLQDFYLTCISIDSILTNTGYRKQWHFTLNQWCEAYNIVDLSWIEGITSSVGLFYDREILKCNHPFSNYVRYGQCFVHRDTVVIGDNYLACEDLLNSYNPDIYKPSISIFPNPAQDYVSIDLPITHNKATLQIYNMQGQLVKNIAINGGGLQRIDTVELPNGIYQLLVSSATKLIGREKLVVAK